MAKKYRVYAFDPIMLSWRRMTKELTKLKAEKLAEDLDWPTKLQEVESD